MLTLLAATRQFVAVFERDVVAVLAAQLRGVQPQRVVELREQLSLLVRHLELKPKSLHDLHAPLLKRIITDERRRAAEAIDEPLKKATQPEIVKLLHRELFPLEELMKAPWFEATVVLRMPAVTDYLSIRYAEQAMESAPRLAPRVYDEKFHILEAPTLFLGDLAHYRHACSMRGAGLAVAYVDIDDFKAVNTRFTETVVDLKVLAPFMEIVEGATFGHGHAYRFGGDEYVILLPNASRAIATAMLGELQQRIAAAEFPGLGVRLGVSIGVCLVEPDCFLTDREILARANVAKNAAKRRKGSIAFVGGPRYASPEEPGEGT